jgi:plastocyanin
MNMKTLKFLHFVIAGFILLSSFDVHAVKWIVNVQNFSFSPSNLPNVAVGDTIRWVWVSGTHTTTSSTIPGGAASWDEPITSSNQDYEYPVTVAGTYNYVCTPHAGMGMVASFTATVLTPLLVSIVPDDAIQGDSFLATITGSNTNFNGSPAVSLSYSNNGFEIINASSVTVISPTVIHAQFIIPSSASVGLWDVHVNSLLLENGFTVNEAVPALISIVPSEADQGESFTGTITGQYTGWSGTPAVSLSFSGDPGEVITGTNVVVLNSTHLTANFAIPADASPGFYNVHVDDLVMAGGFSVIEIIPAISFMSPNSAHQGDMFNGTIFGQNTTWSGTPTVYLSFSNDPSEMINGTNVVVVNNTELTADFSVPSDASTGNYTIHVDALEQANGFTVLAILAPAITGIIPDNGDQGSVVSTTITAENTSFMGSSPSVSLSLVDDPSETIAGSNVVVLDNTSLTADFDIPFDATPGIWNLNVDELLLENAFEVDEVVPYLLGIDPDSALQGALSTSLVTAMNSHFTVAEPSVSLNFPNNPSEVIMATDVNVINDTELEATFDIPANASPGNWDLNVGEMELIGGFRVILMIGVPDSFDDLASIYPNPATGILFIENIQGAEVSIYNILGRKILTEMIGSVKQTIDVSNFDRGIYIIKIRMNGQTWSERLILD